MFQSQAIFAGCNRALRIFDFNVNTKNIAYGSHNTIQITSPLLNEKSVYDPTVQPIKTLKHIDSTGNVNHAEITCLRWLPSLNKLVTAAQDGNVGIWDYSIENEEIKLNQSQLINVSNESISCIGLPTTNLVKNELIDFAGIGKYLIFGDSKGTVVGYLYDENSGEYHKKLEMTLPFGFFAMCISLVDIPNSNGNEIIAFIGGSKPVVNICVLDFTTGSGAVQTSLPGHEDWVRSLAIRESPEIIQNGEREFFIASSCLDRVIRLWKLTLTPSNIPEQIETNKLKLLTSKEYKFKTFSNTYRCKVLIDAVLMGHDDWVGDLNWKPNGEFVLMSSSSDSSVMLWTSDKNSGVWYPNVRLGDIAIKGASTATGSSGGFWSCLWIVDGDNDIVLANGKTGTFRCWTKEDDTESLKKAIDSTTKKQDDDDFTDDENEDENDSADENAQLQVVTPISPTYTPQPCMSGPSRDVTDLSWSPNGKYLLGTSLDQTTRLYAEWEGKWFEFARPQIHGFDMISVACISDTKFVSAGDEKVLRVFEMPKTIANMLERVADIKLPKDEEEKLPETATLPVLGLSNKADMDNTGGEIKKDGNDENEEGNQNEADLEGYSTQLLNSLNSAPMEEVLQRYTLWPEIEKLYGHGFEITTLDVSPDRSCVVSASRSNVAKHAGIRVFDSQTWLEIPQLEGKSGLTGHDLTVTRVKFNGKQAGVGRINEEIYLLAVSRDRKLSLWRKHVTKVEFELIEIVEKAHTRIIWDCAWVESKGKTAFVTVSRDKEIKLWQLNDSSKLDVVCKYKFEAAATAVDSFSIGNDKFILGVGLDNGEIYHMEVDINSRSFSKPIPVDEQLRSGNSITKISFCPKSRDSTLLMSVGSKDGSLRILSLSKE